MGLILVGEGVEPESIEKVGELRDDLARLKLPSMVYNKLVDAKGVIPRGFLPSIAA